MMISALETKDLEQQQADQLGITTTQSKRLWGKKKEWIKRSQKKIKMTAGWSVFVDRSLSLCPVHLYFIPRTPYEFTKRPI
ncbi:hypothetical protein IMZ48_45110 [Candidatus Bathyarchaeota archaeon]|nr:hypothetical protein [Candidatus Bathyarchaeota archaeon]